MTCEQFAANPSEGAGHLEQCSDCRKLMSELDELDRRIANPTVGETNLAASIGGRLPLAPWEGAGHRPWRFLIPAALGVIAAAALLFALAGVSPLEGLVGTTRVAFPPLALILKVGRGFSSTLSRAPMSFHLTVVVLTISLYSLLALLLKRRLKGLDGASR